MLKLFPDGAGPIAPAEAVLAVIGMRPVVTRVVEPIAPDQWRRARDLQFEINKAAHALVAGDLLEAEDSHDRPGYMRLLRDLAQTYQPAQVKAMLDEIPPELADAAGPFVLLAAQAFQFLASQLPRQFVKSISNGVQPAHPPGRLLDRFDALYDVLDAPESVLNRAATGQLLKAQVAAASQTFPTLVDYCKRAVAKELVLAQAHDHEFQLPRRTEIGLETLLGVDITGPALRQLLQAPPAHAQGGAAPPGGGAEEKTPQQFMTRTQRTDANAP